MTFQDAQQRLLAYVRDRIHNGELTERGFARLTGISQPHVHNVLKGVRNLSLEISDFILKNLHLSILDLASAQELQDGLNLRGSPEATEELPVLDSRIGHGRPWPKAVDRRLTYPAPRLPARERSGCVMVRFAPDFQMPSILETFDIAMLDTAESRRVEPSPHALYAIERSGEALFRYIRRGTSCFYLITELNLDHPEHWERIPADLLHVVKARVLWLGREKDRGLTRAQRGRFLVDVSSS